MKKYIIPMRDHVFWLKNHIDPIVFDSSDHEIMEYIFRLISFHLEVISSHTLETDAIVISDLIDWSYTLEKNSVLKSNHLEFAIGLYERLNKIRSMLINKEILSGEEDVQFNSFTSLSDVVIVVESL